MSVDRTELVATAQTAVNRLEQALTARDRGEAVDLGEAAEVDTTPFDEDEDNAMLVRCGAILREKDPATYRLVRAQIVALVAVALAPVEN